MLEKVTAQQNKETSTENPSASQIKPVEEKNPSEKTITEPKTKATKRNTYTPAVGTEELIHAQLVRGRRFNPHTGKEESQPFTQMFTYPEWLLFKKNYVGLGYEILKILHNPYEKEA